MRNVLLYPVDSMKSCVQQPNNDNDLYHIYIQQAFW